MAAVKRRVKLRSRNVDEPRQRIGWGARIEAALLAVAAAQERRVTLDKFGEWVAAQEGREAPYKKAAVSSWIKERNEPTFAAIEAIARLAKCDPWWIVWKQGKPPQVGVLKLQITTRPGHVVAGAGTETPKPSKRASSEGRGSRRGDKQIGQE